MPVKDDYPEIIGYVLKGYGRTSETFISNEIALLEEARVRMRIFSLKRLSNELAHGVTHRIGVQVTYLPELKSADDQGRRRWRGTNWSEFGAAHLLVWRQHPWTWLRTLFLAIYLGLNYGRQTWRSFVREFLQAGVIAAEVLKPDGTTIAHLHAHFAHTVTTVTWFAARLCKRPFSFTAHAKDIYRSDMNPGDLLARKLSCASFIVTCTETNADHLALISGDRNKIHCIYHGIDTELFRRRENCQTSSPPLILAVGRFVEKKGFPDLVEACRILRDQGVEFRALIIGGYTVLTDKLRQMIDQQGLNDLVSLHAAMTQERLVEIYTQATVFALPSLVTDDGDRDGIPNVLVEAMATGLPVVSTRVSGIPELIHNEETGLLVAPRDPVALAAAIGRLLADPPLRTQLGVRGRQLVEDRFDARTNISTLKQIFAAAIERVRS